MTGPKPFLHITGENLDPIAQTIKSLENFQMTRGGIAEAFADMLSTHVPGFNREVFVKSCLRRERKPKKGEFKYHDDEE